MQLKGILQINYHYQLINILLAGEEQPKEIL